MEHIDEQPVGHVGAPAQVVDDQQVLHGRGLAMVEGRQLLLLRKPFTGVVHSGHVASPLEAVVEQQFQAPRGLIEVLQTGRVEHIRIVE